jgi:isopropylmalate/homocitrate/citramalate synthase
MHPTEAGPEYFREIFPHDRFPVISWETPPPNLPAQVWTTETTHRDGQQGGLPLNQEHSLRIYELLCRFTGKSGAIRQAEFFVYRSSDREALVAAQERYRAGAPIEPTTWIRATRKDVDLLRELRIAETGLLASISDYHVFHKFSPGGRAPAANQYLDAVKMCLDAGIRPRLHLEDATRASIDYVLWFVTAIQQLASSYPDQLAPKFRVCDTLGLGLPFAEARLPRSIPRILAGLRAAGVPTERLEFHPHNDTGLIVSNCLAAILSGCSVINGTCLGKGERTGNAPLELVLLHLCGLGFFSEERPDFPALNELASLYATLGEPLAPKHPLFGRDAHRTRAGIHADGLNKFWWMYAPFNVPALLGRPLEVSLTKDSGLAGLVFLARQRLGQDLKKQDPAIKAAANYLEREFESGRQTAIEWPEIEHFFICLRPEISDKNFEANA